MTNETTWADLAGFSNAFDAKETEKAFNIPIGGAFFDVGVHEAKIKALSPYKSRKGNKMLILELEGSRGETIRSYIPLAMEKDGTKQIHFRLVNLIGAVLPSPDTRIKFLTSVDGNPTMFGALIGLSLKVDIMEPKSGFTVVKNQTTDTWYVIDAETKEKYEDLQGEYSTAKEASEAAKEENYRRAYNEVGKFFKGADSEVTANEEAVSEALRSAEAVVSSISSKKSSALRPASI